MFEGQRFTVLAVDGAFLDAADPGTDALRFYGLTWEEAVELARLSFDQGYQIVVWRAEESADATQ